MKNTTSCKTCGRDKPRVVKYSNYNMAADPNEYKREMVPLHLPFCDEENEVIAERKYVQMYADNIHLNVCCERN